MKKTVLLFLLLAVFSCQDSKDPINPLIGTWKSLVPANPPHVYEFRLDGVMCHMVELPGLDTFSCGYRYDQYVDRFGYDSLVFTLDGDAAIWRIDFIGTDVLRARVQTTGTLLYHLQYFERIK